MSSDRFFQLSEPYSTVSDEGDFWDLVSQAHEVVDVLYEPEGLTARTNRRAVNKVVFRNVSFSKTKLSKLVFNECEFRGCRFIGTHFDRCKFSHCYFESCNLYAATFENCYVDPATFLDAIPWDGYENIRISLFHELARNSAESNQAEFRAEAEFRFRQAQRLQLRHERRKRKLRLIPFCSRWSLALLLELSMGYGWRTWRTVGSIVTGLAFMVVTNWVFWRQIGVVSAVNGLAADCSLASAIYFSATFGSGGLVPSGDAGFLLLGLEAILGVV